METIYKVVLGFQQACLGSYEDAEIAENIVGQVNGISPGEYIIVHTEGFFSVTLRSPDNSQGYSASTKGYRNLTPLAAKAWLPRRPRI